MCSQQPPSSAQRARAALAASLIKAVKQSINASTKAPASFGKSNWLRDKLPYLVSKVPNLWLGYAWDTY